MGMNGESCVFALPRSNTTFRSTSVKSFYIPDERVELDPEPIHDGQEAKDDDTIVVDIPDSVNPQKRARGRLRKNPVTVFLQDNI